MKTLACDENNNLIISQGSLQVKDGINALAQDIKTRIGLCARENPFDLEEGIDFDNEILGKAGGQNYYKQAIRNRILDNPTDIDNIRDIQFTKDGDTANLLVEIESTYGAIRL
ncbi:MAG: hypothetical protein J1F17_04170 [Oscillospiraceae bacterium]|nr:hypothetical protein [Oscillospiraceae bacterium]